MSVQGWRRMVAVMPSTAEVTVGMGGGMSHTSQHHATLFFFFRGCKQHSRLGHASAVWNTAQRTLNPATTQRSVHGIKRDVQSFIH